jgi:penicillin-binding protein 2
MASTYFNLSICIVARLVNHASGIKKLDYLFRWILRKKYKVPSRKLGAMLVQDIGSKCSRFNFKGQLAAYLLIALPLRCLACLDFRLLRRYSLGKIDVEGFSMIKHSLMILLLLPLLVACSALPIADDGTGDSVIEQAGLSPQEVVESFLNAWAAQDFQAMHSLLSPRSVEIYPYDDFAALYSKTHADIGFENVSYTLGGINEQGNSAAINYDVMLNTNPFGDIPDTKRTIRLVRDGDKWEIAWSPMDIINGMTANVILSQSREFPDRGNIYDSQGRPLVTELGRSIRLVLRLSEMRGEAECTDLLSRIMLRPASYFTQLYIGYRAADSAFFVGEIEGEIYSRYENELVNLCGTDVDLEFIGAKATESFGRSYFGNGALAHVTGYFGFMSSEQTAVWQARGYSDTDWVGGAGIEYSYQDILAGSPDQSLRLIDSSGAILRSLGSAEGSPAAPVQLTIDRELQWDTAQAFSDAWNYAANNWVRVATGGAAVVMDVNTGAVLSMYSFPTYDPRIFNSDSSYWATSTEFSQALSQINRAGSNDAILPLGEALRNRAFSEQYAPGSTFKIVSTLAAADSGIWRRDQLFDCQLQWFGRELGDSREFRTDWRTEEDSDPAGEITMAQALMTSCNPFFWQVGAEMYRDDPNMVYNYARQFGLGQATGLVGLENEASGNIPQPDAVDVALNDVIGQGDTTVTALQMARLVAAVANGGTLYKPYIVQQVGGFDDVPVMESFDPIVTGQLDVSPEALSIVREGMCGVPTDPNFGTSYSVFDDNEYGTPPYSSCGKTGTAEATPSAPIGWYVAYAPADNPVIAIAVVVPNSRHGSEVAAPITRRIFDHYFNAPNIVPYPDWWNENEYVPVPVPEGF